MAVTPIVAGAFVKKGFTVNVEENAGFEAKFRNEDYLNVGAKVVNTQNAFNSGTFLIIIRKYMIYYLCYSLTDIVLKVRQPLDNEVSNIRENSTLISFLYPAENKPLIDTLASKKINAFGKL